MKMKIIALVILVFFVIPCSVYAGSCTQSSDCGEDEAIGYAYCEGDNLRQNYHVWECISSECSSSVEIRTVKMCTSGCTDDMRYTDMPSCTEDIECPDLWSPVCGEDYNTYPNECSLYRAGVYKKYDGECRVSNNAPEIILPGNHLNPEVGDGGTEFEFRAIYRDADGDFPEYVKLQIGGEEYYMGKVSNETSGPENGTEFYIALDLPAGSLSHKFIASDSINITETDALGGPEVWNNRSIKNPAFRIINPTWAVSGLFSESALVFGFQEEINSFLETCQFESGFCRVPLTLTTESDGKINITDLRVFLYEKLDGDTDNNYKIDISDLARVGWTYGNSFGDDGYNPNNDVTGDGEINIFDLATVGVNYGNSC